MSTVDTVKSELTAIISKANTKTGGSDKTVSAAVDRLVGGYNPNGITPAGTKTITSNGSHDVTAFATAQVNVPVGVTPSGTKTITTNGSHDVTNYATAQVNVPVGITPSGSKTITENGTYDVTSFASAVVNVASSGVENCVTRTVTKSSALGGTSATINTLISGDSFVKSHYNDAGFFVMMIPTSPVAASTGAIVALTHTNRQLSSHSNRYTGWGVYWSSTTVIAGYPITTNVNGNTYQAAFRVNSSGNVVLYLPANRYLSAGTYQIVMGVAG